jgi:hypothetical protein
MVLSCSVLVGSKKVRMLQKMCWHHVITCFNTKNVFTNSLYIISGSTDLVMTLATSLRRFGDPIKTRGRIDLDEWSARRKVLCPQRTTQLWNTKTNIHASSGIRTHDPSNQTAKTYALDRAATGTGLCRCVCVCVCACVRACVCVYIYIYI